MLGSREGIARAKAEIVSGMPASAENFEGNHSALVLHLSLIHISRMHR